MDLAYEKILVKSFFVKRVQDRILFELASTKKRGIIPFKLNNYMDFLKEQYMIRIPKPNFDYRYILNLLKEYGAGESCYANLPQ
ncbi:hypothetical protein SAMN05444392_10884 [Seinonella peptonophila]|uniref:Uncharacterized protein n=1 Tax=Seinonella peptonophila TaxID=112248 RepID=A0A1M4Z7G3_9BACL|nr:hypothetical protein [Seinonella peptonophila]SHF13960.1 hypothetical protein SAMN05444392_10884 [Seinonella peptonophila]